VGKLGKLREVREVREVREKLRDKCLFGVVFKQQDIPAV
jgi:hypothetical protein